MIEKNAEIGKRKNVMLLKFGKGDITFSIGRHTILGGAIVFYNSTQKRKVGETFKPEKEKLNDLPFELMFAFENPESITALMQSLLELQGKMVFNK